MSFYDAKLFARGWKEDTFKQPPQRLSAYEKVKISEHKEGEGWLITFRNSENCYINLLNSYQGIKDYRTSDYKYDAGQYSFAVVCKGGYKT